METPKKIRVLIVDDSALVRRILTECLAGQPDLEVVGAAADPYIARDMIVELQPDVLTLDLEMPRMDGLTFLRKLMRFRPMPVIVISSLAQASCATALRALEEGAVDTLGKPAGPYSVGDLRTMLADRIRAAAKARVRLPAAQGEAPASPVAPPRVAALRSTHVIAIGASTGGTEAIRQVLEQFPANIPGVVITQHIPAGFSKAFSERLNHLCRMEVKEAADGDELYPGRVLVAPGGFHMMLRRAGSGYRVAVQEGPRVCYQRPSVDVLFRSVAEAAGPNAVGALLTGMGSDGATGLSQIRQSGAPTIAQDEDTCVVFGMPREAIRLGAAAQVLPLQQIAPAILRLVTV
ncbi:MAG TPA: chemotaxis response regulator protein-glutamate methylesterase [Bryobacteraceae bacterium]|nr:chemotaxis response regulator protein-glutamate methylesterase [Bryobacteraceae bacterium]